MGCAQSTAADPCAKSRGPSTPGASPMPSDTRSDGEPPYRRVHLRVSDEVVSAEQRSNALAGKIRATRIRQGVNVNSMFEISDVVFGYGSYGVVLRAKSLLSKTDVAIKVIPTKDMDEHKFKLLFNEVENCLHLDHPNICRVFEVYEDDSCLQLVMEGCFGRTLYDELQVCERYTPERAAVTCKQMLEAVHCCHKHKVCHRDLKLDNWVYKDLTPTSQIKLIDFGFSMMVGEGGTMESVLGTCYYVAPEVIDGPYDKRCDLWSLGIVAYMLLCGVPPFWGRSNSEILDQVKRVDFELFTEVTWQEVPEQAVDFVSQLLQRDPDKRPQTSGILRHPWLPHGVQEGQPEGVKCDQQVLCNLRTFAQHTPVKRTALSLIASHLSHTEASSMEEQFHQLDFQKNGAIDLHELTSILKRELHVSEAEARKIFCSLDCLGESEIHYTEFLAAATDKDLLQEGYLREAFKWFDQDDDGYISLADLRRVLGDEVQGKRVDEVLHMLDMKKQGKVDTDDWLEFMLRVDCHTPKPLPNAARLTFTDGAPPMKESGLARASSETSTCLPSPRSATASCPSVGERSRPAAGKVELRPMLGDASDDDFDCEV